MRSAGRGRRAAWRRAARLAPMLGALLLALVAGCGPSTTTPGRPTVTAGTPGLDTANMLFEAGASTPGQFTTAGLTAPGIQGDDVVITWSWLEPNAPVNGVHQYNWAPFDSQIAAWHQAGKRVMLLVRYVGTDGAAAPGCAGPQLLPDWEIARVPHTCGMAGEVLPDYFDSTFTADLDGFVAAIGAHYAQSPDKSAIVYARIATGVGGEETAVKGDWRDWAAFQQMAAWGYTPYAWRDWVEARLSGYHQALPWATVLNAVDVIVDSANNCSASGPCHFSDPKADPTTGQTGLTIQAQIAYWAAAHGLGIGQQGLAPGYDTGGIREITAYVVAHWPSTFIEFQTDKAENDQGSVQGNIQTAYCYGGKAIEWYPNVATNPAYQQMFAQWNQLVRGQAQPPSGYCDGL